MTIVACELRGFWRAVIFFLSAPISRTIDWMDSNQQDASPIKSENGKKSSRTRLSQIIGNGKIPWRNGQQIFLTISGCVTEWVHSTNLVDVHR